MLDKIQQLKSDLVDKDLQIESYKVNYEILKEEKQKLEERLNNSYNKLGYRDWETDRKSVV